MSTLYRFYQRATQPYQYQSQNKTQSDVETEIEPVFLLQEQVHVIGERREGGESAAESSDQEDVHRWGDNMGFLGQAEEDADHETADYIDGECAPGKSRNRDDMSQFPCQKAQACADKATETCNNHCFEHNSHIFS